MSEVAETTLANTSIENLLNLYAFEFSWDHDEKAQEARAEILRRFSEGTRWIPVSERLPEFPEGRNSVQVIACGASGVLALSYVRNVSAITEKGKEPRWKFGWGHIAPTPTHWMPLPEAV